MATYDDIINDLKETTMIFYRFQGSNSFEYFNIKNNRFETDNNNYVYFSRTKKHHYYFTVKRLRQLINIDVLKDTDYVISNKTLNDKESFKYISNLIINSLNIKNLNSISLACDKSYYMLLKENSINSMSKVTPHLIERVDRRLYGGGYGVEGYWLDLLEDLTFFTAYTRISVNDILTLLDSMRRNGKLVSPYLISDILENKLRKYKIKDNLYNDFHKYNIMNDLENIYDERMFLENSHLSSNPRETIREILKSYQDNREKVLRFVDDKYHNYQKF